MNGEKKGCPMGTPFATCDAGVALPESRTV
jgi:hypothetical protein